MNVESGRYALLAEFSEAEHLVDAARRAWQQGFRRLDALTPFPVEELAEAIGFHRTRIPLIVLIGGLLGGSCGYLLQYWVHVIEYPINVGGRPYHSWPSFVPVTFELTVLFAAFFAIFGMFIRNGLPLPYHPLFNVDEFQHVTQDKFFLCIEATDPLFDEAGTRQFLEELGAEKVYDVPHA